MEAVEFCGQCGASLPPGREPCPVCGRPRPPPVQVPIPAASAESKDIYRTRLALLILAVGVVASVLTVGAIVGEFLILLAGALLITAGQPFGRAHARYAMAGILLALVGGAASLFIALVLPLTFPPPPSSSAQLPAWAQGVEAAFSSTLLLLAGASAVSGFGLVLVTYALQDRVGKACLWTALTLGVGLQLALYFVVTQEFSTLLSGIASGQGLDVALLNTLVAQLTSFTYLQIIPQALFAASYFLADTRIRHGAIPERPNVVGG